MITDKMVKKAAKVWYAAEPSPHNHVRMRAALEAVAPALIAQGMREAAELCYSYDDRETIIARAQELDPQYDPTTQPYDEPFRHKEELDPK